MMTGASCAARLPHHNPWTCGNLAGSRKRAEFREEEEKKDAINLYVSTFVPPPFWR